MITKLSSQQTDFNTQLSSLLSWESVSNKDVANTVEEIINTIRSKGDKALIDYSIKFDGVKAKSMADLMVSQEELEKSFNDLSDKQKNAITIAAERVKCNRNFCKIISNFYHESPTFVGFFVYRHLGLSVLTFTLLEDSL